MLYYHQRPPGPKTEEGMVMMYFKDYGELEWLEVSDYYAEPWRYHGDAEGEDGELYSIVESVGDRSELRYTIV